MPRTDRHVETLWWGLLCSVLLHALLGTAFVRYGAEHGVLRLTRQATPAKPDPAKPKPRPRQEPRIALGREDSSVDSMTWLGFQDSTEHLAPQSIVDQSAMSRGQPTPQTPDSQPPEPAVEPSEASAETPRPLLTPVDPDPPSANQPLPLPRPEPQATTGVPTRPAEHEVASTPHQDTSPATPTDAKSPTPDAHESETNPPQAQTPPTKPEKDATPDRQQAPQPLAVQPPQRRVPEPSAAKPKRPRPSDSIPGLPSDKEALAAAIKGAPIVRPGRVAAQHGLDVKTVAPRWSYTTTSTQRPRNPTIYIVFGRDGKVKDADFIRDGPVRLDTGSDEVNEPLLTAMYSWTASGKALRDLPQDDPNAGVTLLFTILLGP